MNEEEEFEFRLRLEQEQKPGFTPTQEDIDAAPGGWTKGMRDPIDALSQMLYKVVPEGVRTNVDKLNNWIADNFGILEKLPEGGLTQQLAEQEKSYQAKRKQEGDEGMDWDRMGGSLITTGAIPGGAMMKAATLPGKMGAGAAAGAGYGVLQPVKDPETEDFWTEKAAQGAQGAVVGAMTPLAVSGGKKAYDFGKTLLGGKETSTKNVTDWLVDQTGAERSKIIEALKTSKSDMPGGKLTPAQAIAKAQTTGDEFGAPIAKLEKELTGTAQPNIGSKMRGKYDVQESARQKIVDELAGAPGDLKKAKQVRSETTKPWYDIVEASEEVVNISPVKTKINEIAKAHPNETSVMEPLKKIKDMLSGSTSVREMRSASQEIKRLGDVTADGKKLYDITQLESIKKVLDKQIGKTESAYKVAQKGYKELSKPINQMQIGKQLQEALRKPGDTGERSAVFLNAMRNAPSTIKKSTGFKNFESLDKILTPEQMKGLQSVADDLALKAKTEKLAGGVKESVIQSLPSDASLSLPHVLSRPVVIANHILKTIGKDKSQEYKEILVDMFEDPNTLRKALESTDPVKTEALSHVLQELTILGSTTAAISAQR